MCYITLEQGQEKKLLRSARQSYLTPSLFLILSMKFKVNIESYCLLKYAYSHLDTGFSSFPSV